jgi:hypothetical protein
MKRVLLAIAALSIASTPALAAPCRDAKGKFIKCPPAKAAPVRCKDAKGRFTKCGTPGAHNA